MAWLYIKGCHIRIIRVLILALLCIWLVGYPFILYIYPPLIFPKVLWIWDSKKNKIKKNKKIKKKGRKRGVTCHNPFMKEYILKIYHIYIYICQNGQVPLFDKICMDLSLFMKYLGIYHFFKLEFHKLEFHENFLI